MFSPSTALAFVDLETTGVDPSCGRIAEIGIVAVDGDRVEEWESFVGPGGGAVAAPSFRELAPEIRRRLEGRLFVAHNARFDHGFLQDEFQRLGIEFRPPAVCTLALSRRLYPGAGGHNLDALTSRHALAPGIRHRALPDARLVWQFWQALRCDFGPEEIAAAIAAQQAEPLLPPQLDQALIDCLPDRPGVYAFCGAAGEMLHVGRARYLRRQVRDYFRLDRNCAKAVRLAAEVRSIQWRATDGMLGARLVQAEWSRKLPRRKKPPAGACFLCLEPAAPVVARFVPVEEGWPEGRDLYGLFATERKGRNALKRLATRHGICPALLGLVPEPCRLSRVERLRHLARLAAAAAPLKLPRWPYAGAIAVRERRDLHLFDRWSFLGTARSAAETHELLNDRPPPPERSTYDMLVKALPRLRERTAAFSDTAPSIPRAAEPDPPDFP